MPWLCVGRFCAGCDRSRGTTCDASRFARSTSEIMSPKSKRRSSLDRRLSGMCEGRGKEGNDGPLPLVGKASSPPRKSWTWASNTGLWFGLAIPVAIAAVACMAVGGAGGESFVRNFLRFVSSIT